MSQVDARTQHDTLYTTDFFQWTQEQAAALSAKDLTVLDWENLEAEIKNLGKSELNAVNSFVKRIIEHRLKLEYSAEIYPRPHWIKEINNFQDELEDRLTPTLCQKIDLDQQYERARRLVLSEYSVKIPRECPYTLEDLMSRLTQD